MHTPKITGWQSLKHIGLSPAAAKLYITLAKQKNPLNVREIIIQAKTTPTTTYRALEELTEKGFIQRKKLIHAARYNALPLDLALVRYSDYQHRLTRDLSEDLALC